MGDDPRQVEAAEDFIEPGAWVSHLVLLETAWVLTSTYRADAGTVAGLITMLQEHRSLVIEEPDTVAAALAGFRARPSVGFADHLVLETARRAGHLPLGTFDRTLAKLEGAVRI